MFSHLVTPAWDKSIRSSYKDKQKASYFLLNTELSNQLVNFTFLRCCNIMSNSARGKVAVFTENWNHQPQHNALFENHFLHKHSTTDCSILRYFCWQTYTFPVRFLAFARLLWIHITSLGISFCRSDQMLASLAGIVAPTTSLLCHCFIVL